MAAPKIKLGGKLLLVFILGGLGGVFFSEILLPALAGLSQFRGVPFFERIRGGTTVITRREEVVIQESAAIEKTVEQVEKFFVERGVGGVALTTDGIVGTVDDTGAFQLRRTQLKNLAVPPFLPLQETKVGKVLVAVFWNETGPTIATGVITQRSELTFSTTLLVQKPLPGSAVFTTKAELVGIVEKEKTGKLRIVPISEIQTLLQPPA